MPHDTESLKHFIEEVKGKWKEQETYKHEFGQPTDTLEGMADSALIVIILKN